MNAQQHGLYFTPLCTEVGHCFRRSCTARSIGAGIMHIDARGQLDLLKRIRRGTSKGAGERMIAKS
jgi:hypothetical protein